MKEISVILNDMRQQYSALYVVKSQKRFSSFVFVFVFDIKYSAGIDNCTKYAKTKFRTNLNIAMVVLKYFLIFLFYYEAISFSDT